MFSSSLSHLSGAQSSYARLSVEGRTEIDFGNNPSNQEKIMKLSNKIVLVTGGTSGIGLEAAKLFREEGATVIIVGQNPDRLQSVAGQLGDSVTVLCGDVSKPAAVESIIKQISEKFGRIDVLFANAGMGLASPLEAVTEDQIDRELDVNFKGVFFAI